MPFNLLKRYPELLELEHMTEKERKSSLRGIYKRDIEDNTNFNFRGKKIYPIKSDGRIDMDRQFTHLTCEEVIEVENGTKFCRRIFDKYRSERLHWIKEHTDEAVKEDDVMVFSHVERNHKKRKDVIRTYIYNQAEKYIVVFKPQKRNGDSYYLLTAYYLNKEYGKKQVDKKLKNRTEYVL